MVLPNLWWSQNLSRQRRNHSMQPLRDSAWPASHHLPGLVEVISHLEDNCPEYGESLTTAGAVFQSHETAGQPSAWLERSRLQAQSIKSRAMAASAARMNQFLEMEQERMIEIRPANQAQRANDRRTMMAALAIGAANLIFILGFGLLMVFSL